MTVSLTSTRKRLGVLTPSSNTVLEPVIVGLTAGLPNLSLHFTRFRVTEISLSEADLKQFAMDTFVEAARLLSDARVDAISWSGTSAAWLGLDYDRALCAAILKDTGTPATTATLSMVDALHARGIRRVGLVTPYGKRAATNHGHVRQRIDRDCCGAPPQLHQQFQLRRGDRRPDSGYGATSWGVTPGRHPDPLHQSSGSAARGADRARDGVAGAGLSGPWPAWRTAIYVSGLFARYSRGTSLCVDLVMRAT
jgi:Arylmalonate decarboxylase